MLQHVNGEAPFQVLTGAFSVSPSNEGYDLQISSDGVNYSTLFSVGAGVTRLITGVASGSYYRLLGNETEVIVNWNRSCNDGGGSGSGSTPYILPIATETTLGGIKVGEGLSIDPSTGVLSSEGGAADSHVLLASSGTPEGLQDGDVFAKAAKALVPAPTGKLFTEVTVPYNSTFFWYYNDAYSELQAGVDANGVGYGPFGQAVDGVIEGPWGASTSGIRVTDNGDGTVVLTSFGESWALVQMFNFDPAILEEGEMEYTITQKQGQKDVWSAFEANTYQLVREDCNNDGTYLMHWNNDENFRGVDITNGQFSENQGYGMQMGADGKMHSTDPSSSAVTAWIDGGKLYWDNPYGVISMLDAYGTGSNLEGASGKADVLANAVMSESISKIWRGTQAEYDALGSYDNNTLYIIL